MHDILHIARDVAALLITVGGVAGIGGIIGYHLGAAWAERGLARDCDQYSADADPYLLECIDAHVAADNDILRDLPFKPATQAEKDAASKELNSLINDIIREKQP